MKPRVKDLLTKKGGSVVTVKSGAPVLDAVKTMHKNKIGSVMVLDKKDAIIGILTERDVLRLVEKENGIIDKHTADDIMTRNVIIGVGDDDLDYIMGIMTQNRIRHIPIMDRDKLLGILSIGDLVKEKLENMEFERRLLAEYINAG